MNFKCYTFFFSFSPMLSLQNVLQHQWKTVQGTEHTTAIQYYFFMLRNRSQHNKVLRIQQLSLSLVTLIPEPVLVLHADLRLVKD